MHLLVEDNYINALLDISRSLLDNYFFEHLYSEKLMDGTDSYLFWKNKNSNYIGCNKKFSMAAGFSEPNHILGKCDYDLIWKSEESNKYRHDDSEVVKLLKPKLNIEETQLQADGSTAIVLTSKFPIYSSDRKQIGILGISTDITMQKMLERELLKINDTIKSNNSISEEFIGLDLVDTIHRLNKILEHIIKEGRKYVFIHNNKKTTLPIRQLQCLMLLLQGKSNKQIGKELNLSPRTIESYIIGIKDKFSCYRKNELVNIVLTSKGFIDGQFE